MCVCEASGDYEVIRFENVGPGDVVIHHPNTVHGSAGNTSATARHASQPTTHNHHHHQPTTTNHQPPTVPDHLH